MNRAIISSVVLLLFSSSLAAQQNVATKKINAFETGRDVVVKVYADLGNGIVSHGSGVWISKQGYIATCEHVVHGATGRITIQLEYDAYQYTSPNLHITIQNANTVWGAKVVVADADSDVAILKVDENPIAAGVPQEVFGVGQNGRRLTPHSVQISATEPEFGAAIIMAGFPLDEAAYLLVQSGNATGMSFPKGTSDKGLRLMLSLFANHGDSGGPVLDSSGQLVGLLEGGLPATVVNEHNQPELFYRPQRDPNGQTVAAANGQPAVEVSVLRENSGISFAVPSKFLLEAMKKANIPND
jgi:S1-C subfamily serine protease